MSHCVVIQMQPPQILNMYFFIYELNMKHVFDASSTNLSHHARFLARSSPKLSVGLRHPYPASL
jgi:hypothetical protein